jgi:peptidoglycan hydrolase CwlO-like protein
MALLFMLLVQSVTGAVITIVALLLVAAIIGYFTSWVYAKSVYSPVIKSLETDKTELIRKVSDLNEDVGKITSKVGILNEKIVRLEEESSEKDKEIKKLSKPKKKQKMDI